MAVHKRGLKVSYTHNFTSYPLGNTNLRDDTCALTVADVFRLAGRMVLRKNRSSIANQRMLGCRIPEIARSPFGKSTIGDTKSAPEESQEDHLSRCSKDTKEQLGAPGCKSSRCSAAICRSTTTTPRRITQKSTMIPNSGNFQASV